VKTKTIAIVVVVVLIGAGAALASYFSTPRLTSARIQQMKDATKKVEDAKSQEKLAAAQTNAAQPKEQPAPMQSDANKAQPETPPVQPAAASASDWPEQAPDAFKVKFECSNGSFTVECHKDWAPLGVQHFYELIRAGFYTEARFFRVVPGFVVQFGLPGDPAMASKYCDKTIKDEPVKGTNAAGTLTYAKSSAPNSRSTQLFINLGNNARLDGMGFSPFAKVTEGMDVVAKINAEYRELPDQGMIRHMGNAYLQQAFPKLDYIKSATLVK
jgi:cyclophilin family peptidyl-prolyl cis-trans isomerase